MKISENNIKPDEKIIEDLKVSLNEKNYTKAEKIALNLISKFPNYQWGWKILGEILKVNGKQNEALAAYKKALEINNLDYEAHYNLGVIQLEQKKFKNAEVSFLNCISIKNDFAEAYYNLANSQVKLGKHSLAKKNFKISIEINPNLTSSHFNLGNLQLKIGDLEKAKISFENSINLKKDFVEAYNNLGKTLQELGNLSEAIYNFKKAINYNPSYLISYWNLFGTASSLSEAEMWINCTLEINPSFKEGMIVKAALNYYQNDKKLFKDLMKSKLVNHPFMRSINWIFNLPYLPKFYFNRWNFFDALVKQSIKKRPFYEFGVWKGVSFKYLKKFYKTGYGFDTFTGLPEDWNLGKKTEKKNSYSSYGKIPNIKGGKFVEGEFEKSLPKFFSKKRPVASLINFDADLYNSTLCALIHCKSIIDNETLLIFDEFIMNENWENDEFKALSEFCKTYKFKYQVIAACLFSQQVAVKLEKHK